MVGTRSVFDQTTLASPTRLHFCVTSAKLFFFMCFKLKVKGLKKSLPVKVFKAKSPLGASGPLTTPYINPAVDLTGSCPVTAKVWSKA